MTPDPARGARPQPRPSRRGPAQREPLEEALAHLLDPIDAPTPTNGVTRLFADAEVTRIRTRDRLVLFGRRLRRSSRARYRIVRLAVGWTTAALVTLVFFWAIFTYALGTSG